MILAVIILVAAFILNLFLPWWSVAIPGFIVGYLFKKEATPSFLWGFLGVFLLWAGQSAFINIGNNGILAARIAEMMGMKTGWLIVLITGVIGGLVSGFGTMTGALFNSKQTRRNE
jgi:hypothetical protein|tara:strand:- start:294 stop:641 length:348 start_codon:yes stop_codon:yes gene_type:complete